MHNKSRSYNILAIANTCSDIHISKLRLKQRTASIHHIIVLKSSHNPWIIKVTITMIAEIKTDRFSLSSLALTSLRGWGTVQDPQLMEQQLLQKLNPRLQSRYQIVRDHLAPFRGHGHRGFSLPQLALKTHWCSWTNKEILTTVKHNKMWLPELYEKKNTWWAKLHTFLLLSSRSMFSFFFPISLSEPCGISSRSTGLS